MITNIHSCVLAFVAEVAGSVVVPTLDQTHSFQSQTHGWFGLSITASITTDRYEIKPNFEGRMVATGEESSEDHNRLIFQNADFSYVCRFSESQCIPLSKGMF